MRANDSPAPITVELSGGTGNQLFQLCAAVIVSKRTDREFRLDPLNLHLSMLPGSQRRRLSIGELLATHELHSAATALFLRLSNLKFGYLPEEGPSDDPISRVSTSTRRMSGYFQRFGLVEEASPEIFGRIKSSTVANTILGTKPEQYIGVHVRCGDYLKPRAQLVHGLTGQDYFMDAIRHASSITGLHDVQIISDDLAAAYSLLAKPLAEEGLTLTPAGQGSEWRDLGVLANSSAVVMSNSSFSWWGAYFAFKQHGALVVAPVPWYANGINVESILFSSDWHLINRYPESRSYET
ncbi:MAG: alpha-1,2-fucosyltransferase [Proteobacteria bacterium]|nr:alpha-1,2-fucosyltransferase [Pseudomonadota bacterium]